MNNFDRPGLTLTLAAPSGGVVSGLPYQIGHIVGIATKDAAQTIPTEFVVKGVVDVPKVADEVWTQAQKLYFDSSEGKFTEDDDTAANPIIGVAVEPVPAEVGIEFTDALGSDGLTIDSDALTITIVDYADLTGSTVSITLGGTTTALLEEDSGDWEAETGNDETATSLAAAIDAIAGVAAAAVGAVVTITPGSSATGANPAIGRVRLDGAAR